MNHTELEKLYLRAKEKYYIGEPILSDEEFDELEERLKNSNSTVISQVGYKMKGMRDKGKHLSPMLSLSKFNFLNFDNNFNDYTHYIKNMLGTPEELNSVSLCIQPKFDGNAINIIVEDGKIQKILTRGDGKIGNDITDKLKYIFEKNLEYFYLDGEYRGEVIINIKLFNEKYAHEFKNARNFVAGVLNGKINENDILNDLTFCIFDIRTLTGDFIVFNEKDEKSNVFLIENGGDSCFELQYKHLMSDCKYHQYCPSIVKIQNLYDKNNFQTIYDFYKKLKNCGDFLLDGFVIKIEDNEYRNTVGDNGHHPRWACAIKFPPEKMVSTIRKIVWNMGKTGELIPLIWFDPIDLSGSEVRKCSGHNWGYLNEHINSNGKILGVGSVVEIQKGGDIIPQIVNIIEFHNETDENSLTHCPYCGQPVKFVDVHCICENPDCELKLFRQFDDGLEIFKIPFLGDVTRYNLFKKGLKRPVDIFMLDDLETFLGEKNQNLKKINNHLKTVKSLDLYKVIYSLSIPNCGISISKELEKKYLGMEYSEYGLQKNVFKQFDEEYKSILAEIILKLHEHHIEVITEQMIEDTQNLSSFTFEMTGSPGEFGYKTKKDVESYLKDFGGVVCKKFDNTVKYLFTDDLHSETSKMKKAKKLNITIIEYSQIKTIFKK